MPKIKQQPMTTPVAVSAVAYLLLQDHTADSQIQQQHNKVILPDSSSSSSRQLSEIQQCISSLNRTTITGKVDQTTRLQSVLARLCTEGHSPNNTQASNKAISKEALQVFRTSSDRWA